MRTHQPLDTFLEEIFSTLDYSQVITPTEILVRRIWQEADCDDTNRENTATADEILAGLHKLVKQEIIITLNPDGVNEKNAFLSNTYYLKASGRGLRF